jgi:hypothetical protein
LGELILVGLFGVVPLLALKRVVDWYRSSEAAVRREARKLPVTPFAEIVPGKRVKVRAQIELVGAPLEAPISGRPCAGWRVELIEETLDEHKPVLQDDALAISPYVRQPGSWRWCGHRARRSGRAAGWSTSWITKRAVDAFSAASLRPAARAF